MKPAHPGSQMFDRVRKRRLVLHKCSVHSGTCFTPFQKCAGIGPLHTFSRVFFASVLFVLLLFFSFQNNKEIEKTRESVQAPRKPNDSKASGHIDPRKSVQVFLHTFGQNLHMLHQKCAGPNLHVFQKSVQVWTLKSVQLLDTCTLLTHCHVRNTARSYANGIL